jgi:hypothetical protein
VSKVPFRANKQLEGYSTSGSIKDVSTKFPDVGEALKTVIAATGDYCWAISVPVRYAHPCKSPDRRLVHAVITDG